MFLYQNGLIGFALFNYKHYIFDASAAAAVQSPNKNWKNFDFLNLALYGFGWVFYITNLIVDNKGGIVHEYLITTYTVLIAAPVLIIVYSLSVASSYGT